ncbi:arginine-tRNA-protein transferase [Halospina denitrificans]|uniref:Aspartate/glutamate leucyltransferase n=1 Tax=Halospina denitrificans TaxID=332522 RepID=A0A4R7JP97_9GAMM|nr:arginyltransferase [Halospina denitrificans]TDT39436.1 arginine-tRNA-protein transferase [Halospina denitrificans]
MSSLKTLIFFATPEHPCSYLEGRQATTMFVDPRARVDKSLYSQLTELGFRRSGSHYYRPHCRGCNACIPVRIPVERFQPDRSQRRIRKANQDLDLTTTPVRFDEEIYNLYERYINERHHDGDMYPASREQFTSFLIEGSIDGFFLEMRREGHLIGVAVVDVLDNGLSAIYTIFEPGEEKRSLGTYAILWQVEEACRRGLPHLYLGYWIRQCRKMNYKTRFRPLQQLVNGRWVDLVS